MLAAASSLYCYTKFGSCKKNIFANSFSIFHLPTTLFLLLCCLDIIELSSLNPITRADIVSVLQLKQKKIISHFASYTTSILDLMSEIIDNPSALKSFCFYLSNFECFNEKFDDIYSVFNVIRERSSFWDFAIFECIIDRYKLDRSQDDLQYRDHFYEYIKSHRVSEFMEISSHPLLNKTGMKELIVVFDMNDTFTTLDKLRDYIQVLGEIFDIKPSSLLLCNIKKGCVRVTLLISDAAANKNFYPGKEFSLYDKERFRKQSVLKLIYDGREFDFSSSKFIGGQLSSFSALCHAIDDSELSWL